MKRTDKEIYDAWLIFKKNNSISKTAKEIGMNKLSLALKFHELGLREYKMNLSQDKQQKILDLYNNNHTMLEISKMLGLNKKTVNSVIRINKMSKLRTCKYSYEKNIFKNIDTEEKAYWLGFLYADEYVNNEKGLELTLTEKDLEHIEKFKSFMNSTNKIIYKSDTKSYRFIIYSTELAQDLTRLGCFQNKSLTLKFPTEDQVPKHLIHHFMRGYFDGDGCITYNENDKTYRFSVVGNSDFLDIYEKNILKAINRKEPNKRQKEGKAYNIRYGGNRQIKKIYDYLYKDATIYLKRKYDKFAVLRQDCEKSQDD